MKPKVLLGLVLAGLVLLFAFQNTGVVEIRFFVWKGEMSRVLVFLLLVLAGFVLGWGLAKGLGMRKGR